MQRILTTFALLLLASITAFSQGKKIKITGIENKVKVIVNEKPLEAGVDPYNKLIDTQSDDNRMKL